MKTLEKYKNKVKQIRDAVRENKQGKLFTRDIQSWKGIIERWQRDGWTDKEINEQLTYNLSYELGQEQLWQQQKKKSKLQKQIKTKKEIEPKRDKSLTISERSISFLSGQMKIKSIERSGRELDYKLMWAVDFISSEISTRAGFSKDKKGELVLFETPSQFFNFTKTLKKVEPTLFKFKASDVRKYLGFSSNKLSLKDIINLFKGLQEVFFEIKGEKILRDVKGKTWRVLGEKRRNLYQLDMVKLQHMISNRWKTQDVYLTLKFVNELGWMFLGNLSCGASGRITLPKLARHELTGYQQNILRELRLWKEPKPYNIIELAKIAGLKIKNISELKKSLIRVLTGLKEKKYIRDFVLAGRGKEAKFSISK